MFECLNVYFAKSTGVWSSQVHYKTLSKVKLFHDCDTGLLKVMMLGMKTVDNHIWSFIVLPILIALNQRLQLVTFVSKIDTVH